jgi:hypothetical protein
MKADLYHDVHAYDLDVGLEERQCELEDGEVDAGAGGERSWTAEAKGYVADLEREGRGEWVVVEVGSNVGGGLIPMLLVTEEEGRERVSLRSVSSCPSSCPSCVLCVRLICLSSTTCE